MNIIISRTDAIGDLVLTLPVLRALKRFYPKSKIFVLVAARTKPILLNNPAVTEIVSYPKEKNLFFKAAFLIKLYKKEKIDHFLFFGGDLLPLTIAFFTGVKSRGGLKSRLFTFLFMNKGIRQSRSSLNQHESLLNLKLLAPFIEEEKILSSKEHFFPEIHFDVVEVEKFKNELNQAFQGFLDFESDFVINIHPGMTGHTMNWPISSYAELINLLISHSRENNKIKIVVSFTKSDLPYVLELKKVLEDLIKDESVYNNKIFYFDGGKFGLRLFCYYLKKIKCIVGPSTGPIHLANVVRTKVLALYSPIIGQKKERWAPYFQSDEKLKIVSPKQDLSEITPLDVFNQLCVFLGI